MELALGEFPYKKWTNIFEQLNAVVNGEPPRLPKDRFSPELQDFVAKWYVIMKSMQSHNMSLTVIQGRSDAI